MKVAMTTGSLSRNAGGLFESVRAMGKGLSELGVGVSVYGLQDQNWERDEEAWSPLSARAFSFIGPRALAWSPHMDAALDEARPDLVALQGLWQYSSISTRRQLRRNGTPYVVSPRGMLDKWALANSRWKKVLAAFAFENAVLHDAACLHALCESEADAIRAYGLQQRIEVIPNGVDLPDLLTTEDTESTEGRKRLLFLGRIHPKKGLVALLKAWADIQNSKSKTHNSKWWQFVIAGWDQGGHEAELKNLCGELGLRFEEANLTTEDTTERLGGREMEQPKGGPKGEGVGTTESKCTEMEAGLRLAGQAGPADSENLRLNSCKLKTERALDIEGGLRPENGSSRRLTLPDVDVVFFGPAFGEDKEQLLRSAEAFILPSFSEGLPMSVLEAWAYGLPVVMTPECNLPEGFASGAALEIRSGEGSFQDGMRTLIEMTDQERAAMGLRGRRLVEEKFTWPKVAAQMRRLYEEVVGR
jgi:glycosyltransferase involved in cell wall biosynthesis